ncbi:hypothetical protein DPEC_G00315600 [Dallia pectoralis]|uniref:Uncharacterized protein n=1 Tax=Dallia pectoralis TaxID=75939 RepID=A0ACC2FCQ7_DALPE|nr:hypothetical protein DPEC_G00315600 [Dallia pectoralis]
MHLVSAPHFVLYHPASPHGMVGTATGSLNRHVGGAILYHTGQRRMYRPARGQRNALVLARRGERELRGLLWPPAIRCQTLGIKLGRNEIRTRCPVVRPCDQTASKLGD